MKLSVCCLTADPGPRVAAVLGQLRNAADEVVVAVDSRVDETRLGHHARIADRVVRFEFAPPIERARPWLYALCSGNWILEIDDDEVMSSSFLNQLPDLIRDSRFWQYWLPCHWLFPDGTHWLDGPPWSFDSNRLVRNDPTTLWAAGLSHTRADPAFPSSYLERGFYHLAYLLTSESQRRQKVAHYLGIADAHRIPSTDRDVVEFYMPDEAPGARPVSVPRGDRKAIAAVLEATGPGLPTPSGISVPLAVRADIDAHWPERAMSAGAYEAKIEILDRVVRLAPGEHRPVHVRITNLGDATWPWASRQKTWPWASRQGGWPYPSERRPQIRLSYRWYRPDGELQRGEGFRTDLPANVPPWGTTVVPVWVAAPDQPGSYLLELDLVHEFVRWFEQPAWTKVTVVGTGTWS